jgi:DNA sulfur modification protein DndB
MAILQFVFTTRNCTVSKKSGTLFYKPGTCVGKHRSYMAAVKKSDEIDRHCGTNATLIIEADNKDQYQVGEEYPTMISDILSEQESTRLAELLNRIEDLKFNNQDVPDYLLDEISQTGLSFEEFDVKYKLKAQNLRDEDHKFQHERAEQQARREAISNGLEKSDNEYCFSFPAVQGIQAQNCYYLASIPIRHLVRMFEFSEDDVVPPELRAQRQLNPARAKKISEYVLNNLDNFVLPAITATVSAEMTFKPFDQPGTGNHLGMLKLPFDSIFQLIDGQHRHAGLKYAMEKATSEQRRILLNETLSVSLYFDHGLRNSQQWFADLNSSTKPASSISALYNQREPFNLFVQELLDSLPDIKPLVDMENSTVGLKSSKLWSLVSISKFITLLTGINVRNFSKLVNDENRHHWVKIITRFVSELTYIPSWQSMLKREISGFDARSSLIISHAVFLEALAMMGNLLLQGKTYQDINWDSMKKLVHVEIDKQSDCWKNRCVVLGKMQKTGDGAKSTAALLCRVIGVELSAALKEVDVKFEISNVA